MRLLLETAQKAEARGRQKAFAEAWGRCPRTTLSNSLTAVVLDDFRRWLADGAQKVADEPATKQPDGLPEREQEAIEIDLAYWGQTSDQHKPDVLRRWFTRGIHEEKEGKLRRRDRAERLFKAKADEKCLITQELCNERVKCVEQELNTQRRIVEDWKSAQAAWETLARNRLSEMEKARVEVSQQSDVIARLTKALDEAVVQAGLECAAKHGYLAAAEKATKERDWQTQEITAINNSLASAYEDVAKLTKERDELARKLESAKAEGRREAFAEAENQYRHLCDCKFHPWLCEKAAGR